MQYGYSRACSACRSHCLSSVVLVKIVKASNREQLELVEESGGDGDGDGGDGGGGDGGGGGGGGGDGGGGDGDRDGIGRLGHCRPQAESIHRKRKWSARRDGGGEELPRDSAEVMHGEVREDVEVRGVGDPRPWP